MSIFIADRARDGFKIRSQKLQGGGLVVVGGGEKEEFG